MSETMLEAMGLLHLASARGAATAQRRLTRAAQWRRNGASFGAVVAALGERHPTANRARLMAAAAGFRAIAWEALGRGEGQLALIARAEARKHLALAKQDRRR